MHQFKPNVLFLNPSVTFYRFVKRISALNALNINCIVLAYERNHYPGRELPVKFTSLGTIDQGAYLKRVRKFFNSVGSVRKNLRTADFLYAFGLDMAILGWVASSFFQQKPKIIYEVGDIREIFLGSGIISKAARWLDKFISKRARLIVVTSSAFAKEYFQNRLQVNNTKFFEIENKLDQGLLEKRLPSERQNSQNKLVIGYFGVIRCERSWSLLTKLVKDSAGRVVLNIHGVPKNIPSFERDCNGIEHLHYYGSYTSPDDLLMIYNSVDLVWVVGLHGGDNHYWAKRCRYYEAGFFNKPMIGQLNTMDGKIIEQNALGPVFDFKDDQTVINSIQSITKDQLKQWTNNIIKMPENSFVYTDEHAKLGELMRRMMN